MIIPISIASGASTSAWYALKSDMDCNAIVGVATPAALTSTSMGIQFSIDGTTALTHRDEAGNSFVFNVTTDSYYCCDPALYKGVPYFRLVVGSVEGADRIISVVTAEVA